MPLQLFSIASNASQQCHMPIVVAFRHPFVREYLWFMCVQTERCLYSILCGWLMAASGKQAALGDFIFKSLLSLLFLQSLCSHSAVSAVLQTKMPGGPFRLRELPVRVVHCPSGVVMTPDSATDRH